MESVDIPNGASPQGPDTSDWSFLDRTPEDLAVSSQEDFDQACKIAHAYAKDYKVGAGDKTTFESIGDRIGNDFQFKYTRGGGVNTLAGQLKERSIENTDCKLPTLIFALAWNELNPGNATEIVCPDRNNDHPFVRTKTDDGDIYGHFTAPDTSKDLSHFTLFTDKHIDRLQKSMNVDFRNGIKTYPLTLEGMKNMDRQFIED